MDHRPLDEQLKARIEKSEAARKKQDAQAKSFSQARKNARKDGLCDSVVYALPTRSASKRIYWRDLEAEEAKARGEDVEGNQVHQHRAEEVDERSTSRFRTLCCKPVHPGKRKCREHYVREVLHVSSLGDARGKRFRPFKVWQLPLADMSPDQGALLEDTARLPLETPYEAVIAAMNEADPSNPLHPIHTPPAKAPRRSRRAPQS